MILKTKEKLQFTSKYYLQVKSACSAFPKTYVGLSRWAGLAVVVSSSSLAWPFTFFPSWQPGRPSTTMPSLQPLHTSNCALFRPGLLIMNGLAELRESHRARLYLIRAEETLTVHVLSGCQNNNKYQLRNKTYLVPQQFSFFTLSLGLNIKMSTLVPNYPTKRSNI